MSEAVAVRRAVAIGGGTGLPNVLRCLLELGYETTAVVTVADDGGSSGALRRELGMLPPGDARNCLVALAPESPLTRLFQYRFPGGEGLAGHALGNLIIAALADIEGDFASALADAARLLGSRGRVLPSTLSDLTLAAIDVEGVRIVGQAAVADNVARIHRVGYTGGSPDPFPPAVEAIREADLVVIGPGSLYTSILPNFLVSGIVDAMRESAARVIYVCNVANQRGETGGMDAADHVRALIDHGLAGAIDFVLIDPDAPGEPDAGLAPVTASPEALQAIRELGIEVALTALADRGDPRHHAHELLRVAIEDAAGAPDPWVDREEG